MLLKAFHPPTVTKYYVKHKSSSTSPMAITQYSPLMVLNYPQLVSMNSPPTAPHQNPAPKSNYHLLQSSIQATTSSVTNPKKTPRSLNSLRATTLPAFATGISKMANNPHGSTTGSFQPTRSAGVMVGTGVRSSQPRQRLWIKDQAKLCNASPEHTM